MMTKEELKKFKDVAKTMDTVCPSHYEFTEFDYCYLEDNPNCIRCLRESIKKELDKLEESNV